MSIDISDNIQLYRKDTSRFAPLPGAEQIALALRAQAGDLAARNQLILHSQALVLRVVCKCTDKRGEALLDLIQEANLGLIHAIELYNPDKGAFSTYAVIWMRNYLQAYLYGQLAPLTLSGRAPAEWIKIKQAIATLSDELHRLPTMNELVQATGLTAQKVAGYESLFHGFISLDQAAYHENTGETMGERFVGGGDVFFARVEENDTVRSLLSSLSDQQRTAFILVVLEELSFRDAGRIMKLTGQGVCHHYHNALATLRQASRNEDDHETDNHHTASK